MVAEAPVAGLGVRGSTEAFSQGNCVKIETVGPFLSGGYFYSRFIRFV